MNTAAATARRVVGAIEDLFTTPDAPLRVEHLAAPEVALSVIVPTLDEAPNIGPFLRALHSALTCGFAGSFEIVVIDDSSEDASAAIAAEVAESLPRLRVYRRRNERGLASAVIRGWQMARGELLATINADFQHPPELIVRLAARAAAADLVVASRYCAEGDCDEWTPLRRLTSRAAWMMGRVLAPDVFRRVSDPLSGCYLVRRSVIEGIEFRPSGYKTLIEILARADVESVTEVGYSFQRRSAGRSKATTMQTLHYVRHLLRLRRVGAAR